MIDDENLMLLSSITSHFDLFILNRMNSIQLDLIRFVWYIITTIQTEAITVQYEPREREGKVVFLILIWSQFLLNENKNRNENKNENPSRSITQTVLI